MRRRSVDVDIPEWEKAGHNRKCNDDECKAAGNKIQCGPRLGTSCIHEVSKETADIQSGLVGGRGRKSAIKTCLIKLV
jgi:hypothetical protein